MASGGAIPLKLSKVGGSPEAGGHQEYRHRPSDCLPPPLPTSLLQVEALMKKELEAKGAKAKSDHWLATGIVVKVMSQELKAHGYYKQKVGGGRP